MLFRSLIDRLLSKIYLRIEKMKGRRYFEDKVECHGGRNTMILSSVEGYRLTILVSKEIYVETYACKKVSGRHHVVYVVSAVASENAPANLKAAISREVTFPQLLPWFINEDTQVQRVVKSYVDIIMRRVYNSK